MRRSDAATVTSRLLAMLCILSVFIPTFIMREPVRSLFMPLTVAVGFAMIAAFLMSSSFVPVLSVWLIRYRAEEPAAKKGFIERILPGFQRIVSGDDPVPLDRGAGVSGSLWFAPLVRRQAGWHRVVSPGGFRPVRDSFSQSSGLEYELTRKCAIKVLEVIDEQTQGKISISMGYVGQGAPNSVTNNIVLFMRGTDDAELRLRLKKGSGIRIDDFASVCGRPCRNKSCLG